MKQCIDGVSNLLLLLNHQLILQRAATTFFLELEASGTKYRFANVLWERQEPAATIWLAEAPAQNALVVEMRRVSCPLALTSGTNHLIALARK